MKATKSKTQIAIKIVWTYSGVEVTSKLSAEVVLDENSNLAAQIVSVLLKVDLGRAVGVIAVGDVIISVLGDVEVVRVVGEALIDVI